MPVKETSQNFNIHHERTKIKIYKDNILTFSIISIERKPGSVISASDAPRIQVILEKLFISSFDESIKFQSSNSDATTSFIWISTRGLTKDGRKL